MRDVLVFQLARFGDIVQTKRLLLSLAAEADVRVHFCVESLLAPVARMLYPFAQIHELPAHNAGRNAADVVSAARQTFALFREIPFSEVYLLNFSPLSFACAALFPPERVRGYARVNGQEMRGRTSQLAFNLLQDRRFAPLNLMDLWAHLHPRPLSPEQVNPVPKAAGERRIGVVMAGRESRRSLPTPELAACVRAVFQARGGPEIVCLGTQAERPMARRLARELPSAPAQKLRDLTGRTSLTDLPEILGGLDVLLTPDTGTMHLAAHLGVPVQAFFLSSAWCYETGPYGFGHKIWQSVTPCAPCRESEACARNLACLAPFSHPAFLAHLAGTFDAGWPDGLLGCVTMLDRLGVTCKTVDGDDPYAPARAELRNGLLSCFGESSPDVPDPFIRQELAEFLFTEKDWMLPDNWPVSPFPGRG